MKQTLLLFALFVGTLLHAQPPTNYYSTASGLSGQPLRTELHNIIKNHTSISYGQIWTSFSSTDLKPNGKIWDIYSDVPDGTPPYEYALSSDQCGNYNSEADCYNREHSWPKSYFNDAAPMYTDLFHIYATDGYVNNRRDNYPYGLVDTTGTFWESENGSRLGPNRYPGYSGTVFEPIDAYKGDLARTYFYMATRYYTEDTGWQNWAMSDGANLKPWAIAMLLEWSHADSVSQKENNRNNAVYNIQHNRNPFIDHPEFIDCIWGAEGCNVPLPVAIETIDMNNALKVFPNPASEQLIIKNEAALTEKIIEIDMLDALGNIIYHKDIKINTGTFEIPVSQYPRGLYWIKIQTDKHIKAGKITLQ